MPKDQTSFSPEIFNRIFGRLSTDEQFKKDFYADPEQALRSLGISLTSQQINALRNLNASSGVVKNDTFDDRLILCSSAGY